MSIVIPSRDRARYVGASIATALQSGDVPVEILVLDNASTDDTADVVKAIRDPRLRYVRSDIRLSMRDNFERGLELARGDYLGFIGDDDGIFAHTAEMVHRLFERSDVMAVAAARAHYYWPDLMSGRRGTALLPRRDGIEYRNSRNELRRLLQTSDYYRLPCIYHNFVRRDLIDRARKNRFFISSQVDIYSAIALSAEDVTFAYSHRPLVINGGSARSNGASHFGGGTAEERGKWKQEDDLGFLPGFENHGTVGSLIVESALRYANAFGTSIDAIFPHADIVRTMAVERQMRERRGLSVARLDQAERAAGVTPGGALAKSGKLNRLLRLAGAFGAAMPIDAEAHGVRDVFGAANLLQDLLAHGRSRNLRAPFAQLRTARRIGQG
ncbi:glycosyltransferase family 2 protein [Sphingomonas sp. Tas61C01]|uniref:glycosyltransferase family 2 protein n=1 Tax=Sphingomonas sp. Tas61C01 TaxID=3458297 RepID=UPI00403EBA64